MPIGILRINAKKSQPNPHIVFIKPLKGPDVAVAQDFLERIAAQCLPIMKENHLSVMSLEEYEPNPEFVGRNFNAGEVIQLVLKARFTGRWLPFDYVQMVMMHELAHCKQMNHSRAFWAVRNQYADSMRQLWSRGYTGDGLWGRGAHLATGEFERNTVLATEILPEHLCGGTYRSRGGRRKRKVKRDLSYQERKERRILKKFGVNGVALGEDEAVKAELEKGKRTVAKPRVAGSKRGRELRAAAALARFGQQRKEDVAKKDEKEGENDNVEVKEEDISTASEPDSDYDGGYEDGLSEVGGQPDALDIDGKTTLLDSKGRGMIKVCEDEDPDGDDAKRELAELRSSLIRRTAATAAKPLQLHQPTLVTELDKKSPEACEPSGGSGDGTAAMASSVTIKTEQGSSAPRKGNSRASGSNTKPPTIEDETKRVVSLNKPLSSVSSKVPKGGYDKPAAVAQEQSQSQTQTQPQHQQQQQHGGGSDGTVCCLVCSFANARASVTCAMCSNVLQPENHANSWRCCSEACSGSLYVNAGDCGVCGVCGKRKG